ncbi:hemerythrin family protein [Nitrogeniibacter mangrovi]|uniref:Hemerythrin family protein n=1 Tax=Nitrogeniibacter mangrovi TaxID=2016596 RepID=A0A6C1BB87_9RHOO|nr:hemerythrin family protein [Nitrogeniibacter mangrovi]QID19544.1 hemerythrin family protein [Nitrogeniibacter mangrovi]
MSGLKRNVGQKIALVAAALCAVLVLPSIGGFVWMWRERGGADAWVASMFAVVVFFAGCAVVLHVMSRPKPSLPPADAPDEP